MIRRHPDETVRSASTGPDSEFRIQLPTWYDDALCSQVDYEIFYPEKGFTGFAAKQICAKCPVREECLNYALENGEKHGIWGGATERERRKMTPKNGVHCPYGCGAGFRNEQSLAAHTWRCPNRDDEAVVDEADAWLRKEAV